MTKHWSDWPQEVISLCRNGTAIPAAPLALNSSLEFDPVRQRALARYYLDAGAGGIAIGVHTTQFEIREAGLYRPVLEQVSSAADTWSDRPVIKVAGIVGRTQQANREADIAQATGYHAGLLSLSSFKNAGEAEIISHCRMIAKSIPLIGFYLQPAVGGIRLSTDFWMKFAGIDNVVAIKIAPFNRYQTLDVLRGVVAAEAEERISLYTGNDDNIISDLITPYNIMRRGDPVRLHIAGGLLGHWSVWTKSAVELHRRCLNFVSSGGTADMELLGLSGQVLDCNAVFFDAANDFKGCIPGIHEVLRRQGLLEGNWCLDPNEVMSPGQAEEIDRVFREYPQFDDTEFVREHLHHWLS